jgi:hypothetical protein
MREAMDKMSEILVLLLLLLLLIASNSLARAEASAVSKSASVKELLLLLLLLLHMKRMQSRITLHDRVQIEHVNKGQVNTRFEKKHCDNMPHVKRHTSNSAYMNRDDTGGQQEDTSCSCCCYSNQNVCSCC